MNTIELKFILAEQNITLHSIDPTLKKIYVRFPDGRDISIKAPNGILNLKFSDLIKQIDSLKQAENISKKHYPPQQIVNKTPHKIPKASAQQISRQCRYYKNCKVKCHRGKTGHMK